MKNTGMTRSLDTLSRIVVPKEMRVTMNIECGDSVEFFVDEETGFMALKKYTGVTCKLCGTAENLTYYRASFLCIDCTQKLKKNIDCCPLPAPSVQEHTLPKRTNQSAEKLLGRLKELIQEHPDARQYDYAKWLGVSQGRVSQLKKLL
ncbi:AbrB/MazE/SpoVT family DNA-binding domain-containing protein [Paenibacillus kribbensis]|uniref:AbrB/MazE/SpoVT family DNA-binding domain-containing protein n=1 Tax=Paenibacillus kribbensis TaxID=172713 RepID=UPI0008391BC8|nr:AbrB/MazE/SpoVT family DNA-binding domain-containing protein [Paenibacillus kribbensis]